MSQSSRFGESLNRGADLRNRDVDGFPDDDFLVDGNLDGHGVGFGDVDRLVDWVRVWLRDFDG